MVKPAFEQERRAYLDMLEPDQQRQVLEYACALSVARVRGTPGATAARFAGVMGSDDAAELAQLIAEDCEAVRMPGRFLLDTTIITDLFAGDTNVEHGVAQAEEVYVPSKVRGMRGRPCFRALFGLGAPVPHP